MYSKCGMVLKAHNVFDNLRVRDEVSWTSLIAGYAKHGLANDALNCLEDMQVKGVSPDALSWNALIAGYAHLGESESVFHVLDRMISENVRPSVDTLISVLTACSHAGLVSEGEIYFKEIRNNWGFILTPEHCTCMVDLLGRAGHIDKAISLIKKMPFHPSAVVWHSLLGACRKWGYVDLGRCAFEHVLQLDVKDGSAYICMANIYTEAEMQDEAMRVETMGVENQASLKSRQHMTNISPQCFAFLLE